MYPRTICWCTVFPKLIGFGDYSTSNWSTLWVISSRLVNNKEDALSVCRCRAQVCNRQYCIIDESQLMTLSVCLCRLRICDKWASIYIFTPFAWRITVGWGSRRGVFASNLVSWVFFYIPCWWSVVGCWCWLPVVSIGGSFLLLVVGCRLSSAVDCQVSIVGGCCSFLVVVCRLSVVRCWL